MDGFERDDFEIFGKIKTVKLDYTAHICIECDPVSPEVTYV